MVHVLNDNGISIIYLNRFGHFREQHGELKLKTGCASRIGLGQVEMGWDKTAQVEMSRNGLKQFKQFGTSRNGKGRVGTG